MATAGKISEIVMHPVRLRVLQVLSGRELTTAELRQALPDIAQATLYRHIGVLVEAGFLKIVNERRIRGAVERTYALGDRLAKIDEGELSAMTDDQLAAAFMAFVRELVRSFDTAQELGASGRAWMGFSSTAVYVDQDDLATIQDRLNETIMPYATEVEGKQRVAISAVVMPVE